MFVCLYAYLQKLHIRASKVDCSPVTQRQGVSTGELSGWVRMTTAMTVSLPCHSRLDSLVTLDLSLMARTLRSSG